MILRKKTKQTELNTKYRHSVDVVSEDIISGWAHKLDDADYHPIIEVRSGDQVLWSLEAATYREDLEKASIGNGQYGFALVPDPKTVNSPLETAVSSVDLYIDGHLAAEAMPFHMVPLAPEPTPVEAPIYRKHLDHVSSEVVRGWVFKENQDNYHAKVEVRCGDVVIASGLAENYREDLLNAEIGDGHYGFSITPQLNKFPSAECECRLFIDGVEADIEPFALTADQDAITHAVYKTAFAAEIADFTQGVEDAKAQLKRDLIETNRSAMQEDFAVNGQIQVAMDSIAELSVRVKVIEQVLVKHFSKTN